MRTPGPFWGGRDEPTLSLLSVDADDSIIITIINAVWAPLTATSWSIRFPGWDCSTR